MIITVTLNPSLDRSLTVPRIIFGGVLRATVSRKDWGGKGFNVSRALQALGTESVAMGFVGGPTGQVLQRGLGEMGIATDLVSIAGETRTNVVIAEAEGEHYVKVNEPGPTIHKDELAVFLDRVSTRICPGDLCILSGSLPPSVPSGHYARLVRLVQARGARALLDTSSEPLRLGCAASPCLVKPNAVEATEMTGLQIQTDSDALDAARAFLRHGVEYVALSLGARGLLLASARQVVRAKPPRVQARNPVGAGDALLAGIAWALERGLTLEEMARWGVAAGTAAAMHEGVSTGTHAEVKALYEKVDTRDLHTRF